MDVPASLRRWFVIHFWADILFAVPLLLVPDLVLRTLGWTCSDPVSPRLVAAALMGIGTQSLLGRNEGPEVFRAMLTLKCLWSGAAIVGLCLAIGAGAPSAAWMFLGIFIAFAGVWNYYRVRLRQFAAMADD